MILNFSEDYILENERVKLVPLERSHLTELIKISQDKTIWTYFFEKGFNIELLSNYINSAINYRTLKKEYPFVIYDKQNGQFAGSTRLYDYSNELKIIKIGHTWLGKNFQGTKLNKNAKYLLFDFAFKKLHVERIGFGAYSDNMVSIKAMESVGCKTEGYLRHMFPSINGIGRTDAILMSILKDEWNDSARIQLKNKLT